MSRNIETTIYIELDCAPGNPRPGDLIERVLADTGLSVADFHTGAPFFGCQVWTLKDAKKEPAFIKAKPVLKERISNLYHAGLIRYGSW